MEECKVPLVAVVGPTASGKTSLAVSLCEQLGGEVVSCDSMQIYKGMPIATATPTKEEMHGIPHHMLNFLSPHDAFSVAKYCELARECVLDIYSRGKLPVLAGGTGLYYNSLVDNIEFIEEKTDFEYREMLKKKAAEQGAQSLLDELAKVDSQAASSLHINNLGRIIRALEIYHSTGMTKTEQDRLSRLQPSPFRLCSIGLDAKNRDFLYQRINARVDAMLEDGLVEEARAFYERCGEGTASQAIGYKELKAFLDGEAEPAQCVEKLKMQTRRFAKRQLTWFRRDERINWLYIDEYPDREALTAAAKKIIERVYGNER